MYRIVPLAVFRHNLVTQSSKYRVVFKSIKARESSLFEKLDFRGIHLTLIWKYISFYKPCTWEDLSLKRSSFVTGH